jgi:hypothetical protein
MRVTRKWIFFAAVVGMLSALVGWLQPERVHYHFPGRLRPAEESVSGQTFVVTEQTEIYFTQVFLRSEVTVVSALPGAKALLGKKRAEVEALYPQEEGYAVSFDGAALMIRQDVDDWVPQDKLKYRLKAYEDHLAVYQGPDSDHDVLIRVTGIVFSRLPEALRREVLSGRYEFTAPEALNDVLENLDEFS